MNIISNYLKDTKTEKQKPGSYEWWYFDAQSVDGYKIVVIFYDGNPFSRRYINALENGKIPKAQHYPAVSISVYENEKPIFYSFWEVESEAAEFSSDVPFGRIEKNQFRGKSNQSRFEYILSLNQNLPNGDSIQANLSFSTAIQSFPTFPAPEPSSASHAWNLVMPSALVEGQISIKGYHEKEIEFQGLGYHDHNTGFEPLENSFQEWYWGRYHLEDVTFVYYLMNRKGSWENKAWFIGRNGSVLPCEVSNMSNFSLSVFGLKTARIIECSSNSWKIIIQLDKLLDNGPFYQRFGGRLLLVKENGVEEVKGISEYLKPSRISHKKYWPLVNMRITYPGDPHWVQKNPKLFRWTW